MSFFFMIVTNWTGTKGRVATFANDIPVMVSESGLVSMMQNIIDIKIFKKIKILTEEYFAYKWNWICLSIQLYFF